MPIYQKTTKTEIDAYFKAETERIERVVLNVLNRVGMRCVTEARDNGSYLDDTGNLRSSIGYAILRNGLIENISSFEQVKQGVKGKRQGSEFINELARQYSSGIVLIVVAGMEYAAYVETRRNVLTSAELLANQLVPSLLRQLGFKR